jgi:glycosyltransferase involved in cell wall biosynthesis
LKFTVVIATYNRPDTLPRALRSIEAQECRDFEVVLVHDGGTPMPEFSFPFAGTFVDHVKNRGVAAAFNSGLKNARGDWITYLADDDIWYPNHLATFEKAIALDDSPHFEVYYSDQFSVFAMIDDTTGQLFNVEKEVVRSWDFDRELLMRSNYIAHPCVCHSRRAMENTGWYDETLPFLVDRDYFRRMAFHFDFLHLPVVTGEYYRFGNRKTLSNVHDTNPEWSREIGDRILSKELK